MKKIRTDRKFKHRTFLTEQKYIEKMDGPNYPPSDRIVIALSHKCEVCAKLLTASQIKSKFRVLAQGTFEYDCEACKAIIKPQIKVQVGESTELETAYLLPPAILRQRLESLFSIDVNYMKIRKPMKLDVLRQNTEVYWNLIWNFTQLQLPYEFMVPYDQIYSAAVSMLPKPILKKKTSNEDPKSPKQSEKPNEMNLSKKESDF